MRPRLQFRLPQTFLVHVPVVRSDAVQKIVDDAIAKRKMWFQSDDTTAHLVSTSRGAAEHVRAQIRSQQP